MRISDWSSDVCSSDLSSPAELAPTSEQQNNWPLWGLHYESGGRAGEPPALPAARRLLALYQDWTRARGTEARAAVWRQMLDLHAEQVFTIGLVGAVRQPVVARSEEHTSELQSLMRISYAVFCF